MTKPVNILLADDDVDDRIVFAEAIELERCNATVQEAADGQMAIDLLRRGHTIPDVVVLDVNMPSMNGIETLKWIRSDERLKSLRVVMLSTSASKENVIASKEAGADIYLEKPTQFKDLRMLVRDLAQQNWDALSTSPPNFFSKMQLAN